MRICHICSGFPPTMGGTETHNYSIVKYLSEKNYHIDVIVIRPKIDELRLKGYSEDILDEIKKREYFLPELKNVRIHNIPYPAPIIGYYKIWKKVREIEEKHGKFDIIDVHSYPFAIPFSKKRKIILSLHFFELLCPHLEWPRLCNPSCHNCSKCVGYFRYFYWKFTKNFALKKISEIMVKYDFFKKILTKSGISDNKISVVPFWIDVEKNMLNDNRRDIQLIEGIGKKDFVFVYAARLNDVKGPDLLLEAFNLLAKNFKDIQLIMIGNGKLRKSLEDFTINKNIASKVKFLGYIEHENLKKYLALGDCLISCQRYENYAWSLLELMSTGKIVVVTNVGGTSEILRDNFNGLLAEPDPESLFQKMKYVIENHEKLKFMGKNAYDTIKEKHSMNNLEKYEKLLQYLTYSDD
jgi:glycosyltransferase involved in cell wall biosynthesis